MLERLRWHELDYRADPDRANEWRAACPVCGARRASLRLIERRRRGGVRCASPAQAAGQAALYEATGLKLAEQGAWLIDMIGTERAQLVVFDTLRSLAPAMTENDGDTVLPVTATLRCIARQTGAAVLVLHHRPKHRPATAARASGATSKAPWRPTREEDVRHREPRRAPAHRVP